MEKVYGILRLLHACLIFRKLDEVLRDHHAIHRVHAKTVAMAGNQGNVKASVQKMLSELLSYAEA